MSKSITNKRQSLLPPKSILKSLDEENLNKNILPSIKETTKETLKEVKEIKVETNIKNTINNGPKPKLLNFHELTKEHVRVTLLLETLESENHSLKNKYTNYKNKTDNQINYQNDELTQLKSQVSTLTSSLEKQNESWSKKYELLQSESNDNLARETSQFNIQLCTVTNELSELTSKYDKTCNVLESLEIDPETLSKREISILDKDENDTILSEFNEKINNRNMKSNKNIENMKNMLEEIYTLNNQLDLCTSSIQDRITM